MDLSTRVRQAGRVAARVIDGKAVIVVIDTQGLHTLNEVGTFVWERMRSGPHEAATLVDAVTEEFEVAPEVASRDVVEFLERMTTVGAVEVEEASP